jgi:hypothetical protein
MMRRVLSIKRSAMAMISLSGGDEDPEKASEAMRSMMGPGQVDQMLRMAVQQCWMALPKERRNADEIERQLRRLLDRAIADLREDMTSFGLK